MNWLVVGMGLVTVMMAHGFNDEMYGIMSIRLSFVCMQFFTTFSQCERAFRDMAHLSVCWQLSPSDVVWVLFFLLFFPGNSHRNSEPYYLPYLYIILHIAYCTFARCMLLSTS